MDDYGTCSLDDAPMLADKLKNGENIIFPFSNDGVNAYVLFISSRFTKIGTLPYGGDPVGSFCVGLVYNGFFYFDLSGELSWAYVEKKLQLAETDAKNVTEILNAIGKEMNK